MSARCTAAVDFMFFSLANLVFRKRIVKYTVRLDILLIAVFKNGYNNFTCTNLLYK